MDEYTLQVITEIQRQLYRKVGKTDAHYKEGYGVIFVPYMAELKMENVVYVAPDLIIR